MIVSFAHLSLDCGNYHAHFSLDRGNCEYVLTQSKILYHPWHFCVYKQTILVGGGSDVKMGCTIYWKNRPLKMSVVSTLYEIRSC